MPIANEKANSRRQVGGTPLDIVPAAPQVWGQDEQRIKERIQNRRDATGFWLKTKRPVGRAEWKLEGAVDVFGFDFAGRTVMDIGSSTGGFTELALNRGAEHVVAIEKGTNQMKEPLRSDPHVDLHEKTDIFTVKPDLAKGVNVFLIDVSFVSLRPVLVYLKDELIGTDAQRQQSAPVHRAVARMDEKVPGRAQEVDILAMLKPQFEAKPQDMVRGVIKNEKIRRQITKDFEEWLRRKGFVVVAKHDSDLPGKSGNIERFYWLRLAKAVHNIAG